MGFLGKVEYDNLIADTAVSPLVWGCTIRKGSSVATYKRGTVFAKSSVDNKLVVLGSAPDGGETLTPDCVLCDDIEVGTDADATVACYVRASINVGAAIFKDEYQLTAADRDALRIRGIYMMDMSN